MSVPDVMVIGAGPVGLLMACEARRHGLSVRIIDQRAAARVDDLGAFRQQRQRVRVQRVFGRGRVRQQQDHDLGAGERFGQPVGTVKTWLRRSLMQLRACLDR